MLDFDRLDLDELCMALEDSSPEHSWWIDPVSGELELSLEYYADDDGGPPEGRGAVMVEPVGSGEGYADMEAFAERVNDPRARDLLLRALSGRGAFRRFKDTLFEFPELRDAWFAFHNRLMERRAIEWLERAELIPTDAAEQALAQRPEPDLARLGGALDAEAIARSVATDLRALYGGRLKAVVLFGSWGRRDAGPESDIDLLVVLDKLDSRRAELDRMSDVLWSHSLAHDTVITEIPVSEHDYRDSREPLLIRARTEGTIVG